MSDVPGALLHQTTSSCRTLTVRLHFPRALQHGATSLQHWADAGFHFLQRFVVPGDCLIIVFVNNGSSMCRLLLACRAWRRRCDDAGSLHDA